MYSRHRLATATLVAFSFAALAAQQTQTPTTRPTNTAANAASDDVRTLVGKLELERYKATIKGLTQFGDRREGTERNRKAVDWIEAQLKSYNCETGRISYEPSNPRGLTEAQLAEEKERRQGRGGGAGRGGGQGRANEPQRTPAGTPEDPVRRGAGGKGFGARTGVNNDPQRQANEALRTLNMGPVIPGPVDMVYCTKWGTTRRGEMYIVGGHMDGIGYGEAANDDGSGTAIVMELARILNAAGVTTDVTIRFALWNGEEGGLRGANAYVAQRQKLQGTPDEPRWLGMVQHDMMMWDHGMPNPDGTLRKEQRREADVNIEFQETAGKAVDAQKLAWLFKSANERYATDYPATVGNHMQNTDSGPFQDIVAAISLRENERRDHIGFGWDPNWHQVTDVFSTYTDADFRLGLNAAQTTLAAIAQLSGAKIKTP
jgi:hypothetical protein